MDSPVQPEATLIPASWPRRGSSIAPRLASGQRWCFTGQWPPQLGAILGRLLRTMGAIRRIPPQPLYHHLLLDTSLADVRIAYNVQIAVRPHACPDRRI